MKILHVVYGMDRGGLESWLMQMLRKIDLEKYHTSLLVQTFKPAKYDQEIREIGVPILRIPRFRVGREFFRSQREFSRMLREFGRFDVVHAHGSFSYGPFLARAARAGVPVRIIHGHNLQRTVRSGWFRLPYRWYCRRKMDRNMTLGLGCSRDACAALFGPGWERDGRIRTLYYGIDLEPYGQRDRAGVRGELGLQPDALVACHVGRFMPVKNHDFILDVAEALGRRRDDARVVLVGDGPERGRIEGQVKARGLAGRVVLTGLRADVPRLLSGMDLFMLPSHHEGLGLVVVEAQAAGLPCLVNSAVPRDVQAVEGLCRWLDTSAGADAWADRLIEMHERRPVTREQALAAVAETHFNVTRAVAELCNIYDRALAQARSN